MFFSLIFISIFTGAGLSLADRLFTTEKTSRRLWLGLVIALFLWIWLPALFAFIFGFTLTTQLAALVICLLPIADFLRSKLLRRCKQRAQQPLSLIRRTKRFPTSRQLTPLVYLTFIFLLGAFLFSSHILRNENGAYHSGQSTFGDLSMHLGFITSIAEQGVFPPDYSIFPGHALNYPFLNETPAASLLLLGASLRQAYLLSALYAFAVVILSVYFFFEVWLKRVKTSLIATFVFFFGSGFGFIYFLDLGKDGTSALVQHLGSDSLGTTLHNLFDGFYLTPMNLPGLGLRWVNPIVDMLIPQRATLFGWAILFPCLYLLLSWVQHGNRRNLIPLAMLAGGLPLIHTHSFVALGIISLGYFLSDMIRRFDRKDGLILLVIMVIYSVVSFHDVGDRIAPQTVHSLTAGETIELEFAPNEVPVSLSYYIAPPHNQTLVLHSESSNEARQDDSQNIVFKHVFTWDKIELPQGANRLRLEALDSNVNFVELVISDEQGSILSPINTEDYPTLFDEQDLHPEHYSYRNSMYFDEIYHGRTAYEFLNGITTYETTHPPLGKILIAGGIATFGMNPFGWRISGILFGIGMLAVLYFFAKQLTGSRLLAALGSLLLSVDFMHFSLSRISTIDIFLTFFILLMYYFMYLYSRLSFYDTSLKKLYLFLGLSGLAMGFAIAVKWSAWFSVVGLVIIYFAVLIQRYREYLHARESSETHTGEISHAAIQRDFVPKTLRIILFSFFAFLFIPALIYVLSYLPFRTASNDGFMTRIVKNQVQMFSYHSTLEQPHAYQSTWIQWPMMLRPLWLFSASLTGNLRESITLLGNPFVFWTGIPAFFYLLFKQKSPLRRSGEGLVLIGYLSSYLPWALVSRGTFIYHYFPAVPFIILMILLSLLDLKKRLKPKHFYIGVGIYAGLSVAAFVLFYPVISGRPVSTDYVNTFLRWLPNWFFVAR